jgi:hypothetical protein
VNRPYSPPRGNVGVLVGARGGQDHAPLAAAQGVVVGQAGPNDRASGQIFGLPDAAGVAAVQDNQDLPGRDGVEGGGQLRPRDGALHQLRLAGIVRIDRQQILTGGRPDLDTSAVTGEVEEHGRGRVTAAGEVSQLPTDCRPGGLGVEQEPDVSLRVAAQRRVGQQPRDCRAVVDRRQPGEVLVVGDADDKGVGIVQSGHGSLVIREGEGANRPRS